MVNTMWELLANGINLAASATGLYSFASGFSVDRNIRQLQTSVEGLKEVQEKLLHDFSKHSDVVERLTPAITRFIGSQDLLERKHYQSVFDQLSRHVAEEIAGPVRLLAEEAQDEMQKYLDSVRVTHGVVSHAPTKLLQAISSDPFRAGMTRMWDISAGGLYSVQRPTILTPQFAPVSWTDPRTHRAFLGEMPFNLLSGYGFNVRAPEYRNMADGHIFSEQHGLYVPRDFDVAGFGL